MCKFLSASCFFPRIWLTRPFLNRSLAPSHSHNPDTSSIYLAVAEDRKVYYPVVCKYADAGLASKVFLVVDPKAGLSKLEDPTLESSVTGGKVAECAFLPLFQV